MELLAYQIILGVIATIIGLSGYIPYFKDILKQKIKPHAFSWLIWGISQSVVFFASTSRGGGAGAWAIGAPALLNMIIFVIAIFKGEKRITQELDTASLILAVFGIALWAVTTNPLWSVIILTIVDVTGYVPTVMKAYKNPDEESMAIYVLYGISFAISILALQSINLTTAIYPSVLIIVNTVLVAMVVKRRKQK